MEKNKKLLSCPHCGGEATVYQHGNDCYGVVCTNKICHCKTTSWFDEESAITAWNARAGKTITDSQVDELFRYCQFLEKKLTDAKEAVAQNPTMANVAVRDRIMEKVFAMTEAIKTIGLYKEYQKYIYRKGSEK